MTYHQAATLLMIVAKQWLRDNHDDRNAPSVREAVDAISEYNAQMIKALSVSK